MFFSVIFEPNAISARNDDIKKTRGDCPLTKGVLSKVVALKVGLE
jgi:hypothetical protein